FSSRRRHTRFSRDWSSDVCSSDLAADPILNDADEVGGACRPNGAERVPDERGERRRVDIAWPVPDAVQRDGQRKRRPFDAGSPLVEVTARTAESRANEDDGGDDADQRRLDEPRRGRGRTARLQAQQGDHACLNTGRTPSAKRKQDWQQDCQRDCAGTLQPQSASLTGLEHLPPGTCGRTGEHGLLPQLVDALSSSTGEPTSASLSAHLSARFTALET